MSFATRENGDVKHAAVAPLPVLTHSPASDSDLAAPEVAHLATLEKDDSHVSTSLTSCPDKDPYETDVEAMMPDCYKPSSRRKFAMCNRRNADCPVWPGQEHWRQKARAAKIKRSCTCLALLSKRDRTIVKVIMVLLIIGIAVAVGVGISKPLGAPIWGVNKTT